MRRTAALGAFVIGVLALPGTALADTQQIGSKLELAYQGGICTNNCLSLQQAQVGGPSALPIVSPANGVVTEWAVRTSDDGALYSLRILRPTSTQDTYLGAGTMAAPQAVPAGQPDDGAVISYPGGSLPIRQGDHIGLFQTDNGSGAVDEGLPQAFTNGVPENVIANNFGGLPADGDTAPFIPDQQHELLLQATIKFCKVTNVRGKRVRRAKAILASHDCGATVVRRPTRRRRKIGRVIRQRPAPGATRAPGARVRLVVGKRPRR